VSSPPESAKDFFEGREAHKLEASEGAETFRPKTASLTEAQKRGGITSPPDQIQREETTLI